MWPPLSTLSIRPVHAVNGRPLLGFWVPINSLIFVITVEWTLLPKLVSKFSNIWTPSLSLLSMQVFNSQFLSVTQNHQSTKWLFTFDQIFFWITATSRPSRSHFKHEVVSYIPSLHFVIPISVISNSPKSRSFKLYC